MQHWAVPVNEEINLEQREVPLIPLRIASVFANKEKEDFDDGDTSVLEKFKPVRILFSLSYKQLQVKSVIKQAKFWVTFYGCHMALNNSFCDLLE